MWAVDGAGNETGAEGGGRDGVCLKGEGDREVPASPLAARDACEREDDRDANDWD